MTGEHEKPKRCAMCGGRLKVGLTTVPLVLNGAVVVVKDVPAEVCQSCHEPYMASEVVYRLDELVAQLRSAGAEVSIVTYSEAQPSPMTQAS